MGTEKYMGGSPKNYGEIIILGMNGKPFLWPEKDIKRRISGKVRDGVSFMVYDKLCEVEKQSVDHSTENNKLYWVRIVTNKPSEDYIKVYLKAYTEALGTKLIYDFIDPANTPDPKVTVVNEDINHVQIDLEELRSKLDSVIELHKNEFQFHTNGFRLAHDRFDKIEQKLDIELKGIWDRLGVVEEKVKLKKETLIDREVKNEIRALQDLVKDVRTWVAYKDINDYKTPALSEFERLLSIKYTVIKK